MADVTTAQIIANIAEETTLEDSLVALKDALQRQVNDLLAGVTLPPGVQQDLNAIFDTVETNKAKLAAATVQNTALAKK